MKYKRRERGRKEGRRDTQANSHMMEGVYD